MSEENKHINTDSARAQATVELSYRRETKGFTIFVHQHNDKKATVQRWYPGKRKKFKSHVNVQPNEDGTFAVDARLDLPDSRKNGYRFDGDRFDVKHAGWYTVLVVFDDGDVEIAQIKIKRFKSKYLPMLLLVAALATVVSAVSILNPYIY